MKRRIGIIALIICMSMLLSFVGCGEKVVVDDNNNYANIDNSTDTNNKDDENDDDINENVIDNNDPAQYIEKYKDPDNKICEVIKNIYMQYNNNEIMDDERKIIKIVELYNMAKWINYEDSKFNFDFDILFSDNIEDRTNFNYQINKWELLSQRREQLDVNILWSDLDITIEDITIKDEIATVSVKEQLSYITDEMCCDISSVIYEGTYTFIKENDCWGISNIYTNDEFDKANFNATIVVAEWLDMINKSIDLKPNEIDE